MTETQAIVSCSRIVRTSAPFPGHAPHRNSSSRSQPTLTRATTVLGGDDGVTVQNVEVRGDFSRGGFSRLEIDTGGGDDTLRVLNSVVDHFFAVLGDGDDKVLFNHNTFEDATLDGGLGFDRLSAHNNTGLLLTSAFEQENIT